MADSHVIARKFRPQTFDQVIGQDAITRTLANAVTNNRVHHAYIFTGARGVGKTTTARIFAKALNCAKGVTAEPCGQCSSCVEIAASRSMDVIEIDAASNTGVDNVRDVIINSIAIAPARDRNKIFIIDEVHMLSTPAFNALLKTVEEPPPRVVFILATTALEKVPETILSRCQVFEFRTITMTKIVQELRRIAKLEGVKISDAALLAIARAGEGSMRDAESALDQVISFAVGSSVTDEDVSVALGLVDTDTLNTTVQAIADQQSGELVRIVDDVVSRGYDLRNFCREMMVHFRALLVVKISGFDSELVQLPETEADELKRLGEYFSEQDLLRFFQILTKTEEDIRNSSQPRFQLEMGLVRMAQARRLYLLEEALERIEELESKLTGGATPSPLRTASTEQSRSSELVRPSTGTRASATPTRTGGGKTPSGKPQARGQASTLTSELAGSPAATAAPPTVAAAGASPARSNVVPFSIDPPPMEELYEAPTDPFDEAVVTKPARRESGGPVERIKSALVDKRKMMIISALDKGTISVDSDYLCIEYSADNASCKTQIETRDNRRAIEDACEQVLGQRLTLKCSIAGQNDEPAVSDESGQQRQQQARSAAQDDPRLKVLIDKFHGEIIEVIKPDQ
ncbi:MAG TPA: DNA polymerase III subunit gamma/tau [Blastocatellia bacterium]|nr:DNA polymerase III subunit gamma/tau [Blastocatellia bacterium]